MSRNNSENLKKLQSLLRELFQFDATDLDFGIYRIMNQKRREIERFIEKDLLAVVETGLATFQEGERTELEKQLSAIRERVRNSLGDDAIEPLGAIRETYRNTPIAKEYVQRQEQLDRLSVAEETEARIYNDLYTFFARYYDNGDFLSQRRYSSRGPKYFIPYNGEEVLLHWPTATSTTSRRPSFSPTTALSPATTRFSSNCAGPTCRKTTSKAIRATLSWPRRIPPPATPAPSG